MVLISHLLVLLNVMNLIQTVVDLMLIIRGLIFPHFKKMKGIMSFPGHHGYIKGL